MEYEYEAIHPPATVALSRTLECRSAYASIEGFAPAVIAFLEFFRFRRSFDRGDLSLSSILGTVRS